MTLLDGRSGHVFVAGNATPNAGYVTMLDARSGAVLRTVTIAPNPLFMALDEHAGRVYVASQGSLHGYVPLGRGETSVLDARNGTVIRSVPVAGPIVVDERTGHAVIVYQGGPMVAPDRWAWVPSWLRSRLPLPRPPAASTSMAPASVSMIDATR